MGKNFVHSLWAPDRFSEMSVSSPTSISVSVELRFRRQDYLWWRIPALQHFRSRGLLRLRAHHLRVTNLSASQTLGYGVRSQRVSANLVGHSPISLLGVRPYATGGLEFDHFGPTSQAKTMAFTQGFTGQVVTLGSANKLGVNFGGGVDWSFFPTLALRLDLRDHLTGTPTYGLSGGRFPISGAAHDVEFSVGLVFHMGK